MGGTARDVSLGLVPAEGVVAPAPGADAEVAASELGPELKCSGCWWRVGSTRRSGASCGDDPEAGPDTAPDTITLVLWEMA